MYGEKKEPVIIDCVVCHRPQVLMIDKEDYFRTYQSGINVQEGLVDRQGKPYLSDAEAEMLISRTCGTCWSKLPMPADPQAYN